MDTGYCPRLSLFGIHDDSKNTSAPFFSRFVVIVTTEKFCTFALVTVRRPRVFQNRVLRRIFGPNRDEVTGEWRKLHNEELNDLSSSPNIIRVIKLRRMKSVGHVARMGRGEAYTGV